MHVSENDRDPEHDVLCWECSGSLRNPSIDQPMFNQYWYTLGPYLNSFLFAKRHIIYKRILSLPIYIPLEGPPIVDVDIYMMIKGSIFK